jgi:hypothetical protein
MQYSAPQGGDGAQLERPRRPVAEQARPTTRHDRMHHQMQLVDQPGVQE